TRNFLRIAIFNISYIRGLFPVPALEQVPENATFLCLSVCETIEGPMIEEYAFSFSYSNSDSQQVMMNISRTGNNKKQGATFKSNTTTDITPNQMRSSACKMVRTLVQLMRTLDRMLEERTILMKLHYYDDITSSLCHLFELTYWEYLLFIYGKLERLRDLPMDYEPPFFRCCSEQEASNSWTKSPLKMEVGNVNSKRFVLALKVKSVLDPCGDENDDLQGDEEVSMGGDSGMRDDSSDSENNHSSGNQYIVAPVGKRRCSEDNDMIDEDDTQDAEEDTQQLARVTDWLTSRHIDTVELTDVLSNFPDISMTLTEELMGKLVDGGVLSRTGRDTYTISNRKGFESHLSDVKKEMDAEETLDDTTPKRTDEDYMYMKALYHALPMDYVTVTKLQTKLDGDANQTTVQKLIDKMAQDGYLEGVNNRRLGKRVVHFELTNKKLLEVKKALGDNPSAMEICEPENRSNTVGFVKTSANHRDTSTCGGLHSIGSDLTHTKGRSDINQNGSMRSEQTVGRMREQGNTPVSRLEPVASRESIAQGNEHN
ncbi:hypothetical protein IFM89_023720, partial [Coptis chinensis]